LVFANGSIADIHAVASMIRKSDLLVAVDGGLNYLTILGKAPHVLIGDLDSVTRQDILRLEKEQIDIRIFPTQKDETDLELALGMLSEFGISKVVIIGATGNRLDHSLGNIHLLVKFHKNFEILLEDGQQEMFLIDRHSIIHGKSNDIVSLIPLEEKVSGITTSRLAYPLKDDNLFLASTRGISNMMLEKTAEVRLVKGFLLCIHIRSLGQIWRGCHEM
jgi:thiamine pyrophosphokinase